MMEPIVWWYGRRVWIDKMPDPLMSFGGRCVSGFGVVVGFENRFDGVVAQVAMCAHLGEYIGPLLVVPERYLIVPLETQTPKPPANNSLPIYW